MMTPMPDLARTNNQIWITRGHLAALAVATAAIAVLAFLVGLEVGRSGQPEGDGGEPAAAAFLPDATDEEALEGLLREVERAQAELEQKPATPTVGFNHELAAEAPPVPPETPPPSAVVAELPVDGDAVPAPPVAAASDQLPTDGWAIQVASYSPQTEADEHVARLREQELRAYRVAALVSGQTWHRVRIGGYRTQEAAAEARQELASVLGIDDLMVAQAP